MTIESCYQKCKELKQKRHDLLDQIEIKIKEFLDHKISFDEYHKFMESANKDVWDLEQKELRTGMLVVQLGEAKLTSQLEEHPSYKRENSPKVSTSDIAVGHEFRVIDDELKKSLARRHFSSMCCSDFEMSFTITDVNGACCVVAVFKYDSSYGSAVISRSCIDEWIDKGQIEIIRVLQQ